MRFIVIVFVIVVVDDRDWLAIYVEALSKPQGLSCTIVIGWFIFIFFFDFLISAVKMEFNFLSQIRIEGAIALFDRTYRANRGIRFSISSLSLSELFLSSLYLTEISWLLPQWSLQFQWAPWCISFGLLFFFFFLEFVAWIKGGASCNLSEHHEDADIKTKQKGFDWVSLCQN